MLSPTMTLLIILLGLIIVIGGILLLRLHAFLALVLASLVVGSLTPPETIQWYLMGKSQIEIISADGNEVVLKLTENTATTIDDRFEVFSLDESNRFSQSGTLKIDHFTEQGAVSTFFPDENAASGFSNDNAMVVRPSDVQASESTATTTVGSRVGEAFGATCVGIGILIALAAIVGKCLLDSGAADRIVRSTLKLFGEKNAPLSFSISGFALSTPVFFDTVFYLMIPLGKAMRMRTGRNYLLYVLSIVTGGTMAHSLVPPTPGPLFVAEELGIDIGMMILGGIVVGASCALVGLIYASILSRFVDLPLRETPDCSMEQLEEIANRDESQLPTLLWALAPILVPVLLISGNTIVDSIVPNQSQQLAEWLDFFGNKNIAMSISAFLAIVLLVKQKKESFSELAESMQAALASAGIIILITAAGGAFGKTLQQTGVASLLDNVSGTSTVTLLSMAFAVTALVRLAQGSATVSMITGVGIMSGFAVGGDLPFNPLYLGLAIGCGSKMFLWMNDSGFWVIGKMSGMTELETLKYVTPMTSTMGFCGLLVTLLLATMFPMVG